MGALQRLDDVANVVLEFTCANSPAYFVDTVFLPPTTEFVTKFRHPWAPPIPDGVQMHNPLGDDAERAWRAANPTGRRTDA